MTKKPPDSVPEKYPKKIADGPKMEYDAVGIAFPKPKSKSKAKKKGWRK